MKCISCETEINPKWKHAIDINVCPFCGEHIMEEHLKNCLTGLAAAMEEMLKYPDQLNDWLLSNHNFIKTDSPKLPEFLPKEFFKELKRAEFEKEYAEKRTIKVKTDNGVEEDVVTEKIQSDEKTNDFFKRAEVVRTNNDRGDRGERPVNSKDKERTFSSVSEKTQHLKDLKRQIEREGAPAITNEAGLAALIDPRHIDNADPEAVAEFQSLLHDGAGEVTSSLSTDDDDAIPSVVLAMARGAKGKAGNSNADIAKLQNMHDRVAQSRANFENGENRGGKGGGFSRA